MFDVAWTIKYFGDNLRTLRKARRMSGKEVFTLLGVDEKNYYEWEGGKHIPKLETLLRLCNILGVSMDVLLRGNKDALLN